MDKFGRLYELQVEGGDGNTYSMQFPLTVEFEVKRNLLASANTATFRIYNLSLQTRNAVNKDFFDFLSFRKISFWAGYSYPLSLCFTGNIKSCLSYRDEGRVDYITEIQAYDFGFAMSNAYSNFTMPQNSTKQSLISQLTTDMVQSTKGVTTPLSIGQISTFTGNLPQSYQYLGFTWPRLQAETSNQCFIDNGKLNILQLSDTIQGELGTINSSTGLLSPPKRYQNCIMLELLFEPRLKVGQSVTVNSDDSTLYNGVYKVSGVEHMGIISGAVNGKCKTHIMLIYPFEKNLTILSSIVSSQLVNA